MEPTKSEVNGVRRTDRRSHNDRNREVFYRKIGRLLAVRAALERQIELLDFRQSQVEQAYFDAQDTCWDGVL